MNYLTRRLIGCGAVLGIAALFGIGMAVYMGVVSMMHANYAAPFKPLMAAYLAPPQDPNAAGPVKGKMVVLDMGKREIDWDVSYDLPGDLKASKPEEVGTVVLTNWQHKKVAEYTNGTAGYQYTVHVIVVDHARRTVVGKSDFTGGPPPESIKHAWEGEGSKPTKEVVAYLKSLPRQ